MRSFVFSLLAVAVIGCSASGDADVEEDQGALERGGTAESGCSAPAGKAIVTISTDRREATATKPEPESAMTQCVMNVQTVQVLGLAEAVQKKVNGVLASVTKDSGFSIKQCEEPFDLDGRAQVEYNADNLLSVTTWIGSYASGAAHPNNYGAFMSFDLTSGERLHLADVIKPEGKEVVKAELIAAINRTKDDAEAKAMWVEIANNVMARSSNVITDFTISKTGLRFRFDNSVSHAMAGAVRDSGYIVPFAKIKAHLKPGTAIAKLAGAR